MLHRWRLNNWGRTNSLLFSFQRIRAAKEQEERKRDVEKHFWCTEPTVDSSEVYCTTYLVFFGDKDCNSCCVQSKGFRYGCLYFHLPLRTLSTSNQLLSSRLESNKTLETLGTAIWPYHQLVGISTKSTHPGSPMFVTVRTTFTVALSVVVVVDVHSSTAKSV